MLSRIFKANSRSAGSTRSPGRIDDLYLGIQSRELAALFVRQLREQGVSGPITIMSNGDGVWHYVPKQMQPNGTLRVMGE